jgi:hypothetical protein
MADPYIPPRPGAPISGTEQSRTTVNIDTPVGRSSRDSGNGFGTGMLVAAVFVVVGILAFAFYGNSDSAVSAPATAPDVTIENNNAPAATAPEPVAPDAAPAEPASPVPDAGTAQPVAPANP